MKKVLFAIHLAPPITGATNVGKQIQNSTIINGDIDSDYINITTSKGLTNESGNTVAVKIGNFLKVLFELFQILRRNKYKLCYLSLTAKGAGFYKDLVLLSLVKLFRVKLIYHFHNKGVKEGSQGFVQKKLYQFAFKNAKCILLSPRLYYDIEKFVDSKQIFYCANGISEMTSNLAAPSVHTKTGTPKFLFLSNMMAAKGVLTLLEACRELNNRGLAYECHFVGAWSDVTEEYFREKCAVLQIEEQIFVHGKRYGSDKIEFFEMADVFVFPTLNETFGLVILEAMQMNLPVISTIEGGIPDIIVEGETGLLIRKNNVEDLSNQMELLIHNPELRMKMGKAGRRRYEEYYTSQCFETNFKMIIDDVLY